MADAIKAYNVKSKKMEEMKKNIVIDITKNGRYFAKGEGKAGNVLCTAMSEKNAKAAIKGKVAKKGKGW